MQDTSKTHQFRCSNREELNLIEKPVYRNIFTALSAGIITFAVFLPSLHGEFLNMDDDEYVYNNFFISTFNLRFFKAAFLEFNVSNWHPLTWISHALDYALWGLNPMGHHLTNNILHAANTFVVVLLVVRLIEAANAYTMRSARCMPYDSRFTLLAAATTGLLFGVHPLHVESVAWVAERKDLLCGLFSLLSVMAYVKYASNISQSAQGKAHRAVPPMRYAPGPLLSALCFFILALLSKPMAVTLPLVLLILDWYPLGRTTSFSSLKSAVMEKLPFFAFSIALSVITILAQGTELKPTGTLPISTRLTLGATALVTYLRKMVLPLDLNPFYSYPHDVSLIAPKYFLPVLLAIGITAAAGAVARTRKIWPAAWGYYVLTLLPVLGIVHVGNQSMADRYAYLPSLGPFVLAGSTLAFLYEKMAKGKNRLSFRLFISVLAAVICASLIYLTTKQTAVWKDSLTLWNYVIEMDSGKTFFSYNNRGIAYSDMGQYDRALEDYNKVIAMNPYYSRVYNNRGVVYSRQGRYDMAIEDFSKAIDLNPYFYDAYNNRGVAFDKAGRFEKAMEDFQKALDLNPGFEKTYINRGVAYQRAGMQDNAIEDFNTALSINPRSENAYNNRGISFYKRGDLDRAVEEYTKAIAINPSFQEAYYNRGVSYYRKGLLDKAVQDMNMSASLAGSSRK